MPIPVGTVWCPVLHMIFPYLFLGIPFLPSQAEGVWFSTMTNWVRNILPPAFFLLLVRSTLRRTDNLGWKPNHCFSLPYCGQSRRRIVNLWLTAFHKRASVLHSPLLQDSRACHETHQRDYSNSSLIHSSGLILGLNILPTPILHIYREEVPRKVQSGSTHLTWCGKGVRMGACPHGLAVGTPGEVVRTHFQLTLRFEESYISSV